MGEAINRFADWLKRPYSSDMSVVGWFALFGLFIVIIWLWTVILRKVETVA